MTVRKILLATGAAALMSTPAWAHPGKGPSDHPNPNAQNGINHSDKGNGQGKSGQQNGQSGDQNGQSGDQHGKSGEHHGKSHKCMAHNVGYVASGTLVSQTLKQDAGANTYSGTVEVDVTHTNRHGAGQTGKVTYEVSKVHVVFGLQDINKDGSVGLDDLAAGDRVHLIGKITAIAPKCKGEFTAKTTIDRIVFHSPAQASGKG